MSGPKPDGPASDYDRGQPRLTMVEWRFDGFPGRVLKVDLTNGTLETVDLDHQMLIDSIGGKGLATELLTKWDTTTEDAYSLVHPVTGDSDVARHPSTPLLIMTGPFQGSKVGSAGRAVVCTRSPLTDIFLDTYIGGNWSHELRRAGWDGLFIHGASSEWVRLEINDLDVKLVSASELVGLTTWECEQSLEGLGECMSIGPGGENGVKFASPLTAGRRAAGRGGSGAQFGYKRLKAITVIGSGTPRYAKPLELDVAIKKQRSEMGMRRRSGDPFYSFGTSRGPIYASATSRMPTANYTSTTGAITKMGTKEITSMLDTQKLSGENWHEQLPDAKQSGCCRPCPIACEAADRPSGVKGRPIHINRVDRPEYETLALLGSNLGIDDSLAVMDGNDACNRLGVDTISSGAALSFICEITNRGWSPWPHTFEAPFDFGRYKQGDDVPWDFGIPELPPLALAKIAMAKPGTEDLWSVIASGAVAASKYVESSTGHPATELVAHCKGLDLPAWDPRGKRGNAMAYMTCNIGSSHMRASYKNPTGLPNESAVDLMPELIESQCNSVIRDSLILCAFAEGPTPKEIMVEAWNGITGRNDSWQDLIDRAKAQWETARRWNVEHWNRLGKDSREEDMLSYRLRKDPLPDGIAKGMVAFVDDEDEEACLDEYYRLRGWGIDGKPL